MTRSITNDSPRCVLYVVVSDGVNSRIRALTEFRSAHVDVVYVSRRDVNVVPARNLRVASYPNPLGVLRLLGLHRIKRTLDSMLYFPTRDWLYVTPVVKRLKREIAGDLARGDRVVVLTCAPPHALGLVGRALKAAFPTIRWVIDWQDLWSFDEGYFNRIFGPYRARARQLERGLLSECDVNITTNRFAKRALEQLNGTQTRPVTVVSHHFGSADYPSITTVPPARPAGDVRRIVYMGGMFKPPKVPGGKFLEALRAVRTELGPRVELHLYGMQGVGFEPYAKQAQDFGLVVHGSIPRRQVIDELRKYDYSLLLLEDLPNSRLIMHLKLPEYLVADRPIVAIVPPDSAVAEIVHRTGTGEVIPADADWVTGIKQWLDKPICRLMRNESEIARFDWAHVKRDWARALGIDESVDEARHQAQVSRRHDVM